MAESAEVCEIDKVLARRQAGPDETEYLVRWRGCDSDQDSWEPSDRLGPNGHAFITQFNESSGHPPTSPILPKVTRRTSLRSRSATPSMSSAVNSPTATNAEAVVMNHVGSIADGNMKDSLANSPAALHPTGGSRWALRRFSHDSTVSGASSSASDLAAATGNSTKTKRKKSDQALTSAAANVPSSSSPTRAGHTSPVRLSRSDSKRSSPGSSSPPPSVVVVPPTDSVSTKTPINIITDYGVISPAPLTPSPSVKSPRGSPRGQQQQQRSSLADSLEVDVLNHAATERRKGSLSPVNPRARPTHSPSPKSPKSPPKSPKSSTSESQQQQKSPISRVKKKLSLDIETAQTLPAPSGNMKGAGRGQRRQSLQGNVGKSAKGSEKDNEKKPGGKNVGADESHSVPPTPDTPVSIGTTPKSPGKRKLSSGVIVKPGKPGPKKGKASPALSAKGPGRKRSLSSSSTGSQTKLKKASSASAVGSPTNSSQVNKRSPGAPLTKKKKGLGVVKTYPSRIRQSRLSLDSQLSYSGSVSPRSLSPKGTETPKTLNKTSPVAKIKVPTPQLISEPSTKAKPGPKKKTLQQKLAKPKAGVKGKGQLAKKSVLNSVLRIKLKPGRKPGRKPGFKVGVTKAGTKGQVKRGRPFKTVLSAVQPDVLESTTTEAALVTKEEGKVGAKVAPKKVVKSVKKQSAGKGNDKTSEVPENVKAKGKTKAKPGRKPGKPKVSTLKPDLNKTPESVVKSTDTSPTKKSPSIAQRKKSNLTLNVANKLKTAAKKRVTLNAPLKTPRKRLSLLNPRSPRKSPRIILKDVIKLSKIEYDMAMKTSPKQSSPKQPSPVAKKSIVLSKAENISKSPKSDESTTPKKKEGKEATVKNVETKKQVPSEKKPKVLTAQKKQSTKTSPVPKDTVSKKIALIPKAKPGTGTTPAKKPKLDSTVSPLNKVKPVGDVPVKKGRPAQEGQVKRGPKKPKQPQAVSKLKQKKAVKRPISPDTSDDDVLYSLNPNYDGDDSESGSSLSPSGASDAKVAKMLGTDGTSAAFPGLSPRKMLLKDSIKPKTKVVKPVPRQSSSSPVSPAKAAAAAVPESAAAVAHKTPPTSPLHMTPVKPRAQAESQRPDLFMSDLPTIPVMPLIPTSPSTASYKSLLRNLPNSLQPGRGGKKSSKHSDSGEEDETVERRVSVRQSESAFRYKEIIVKKCAGYTQMWLFTTSKTKNALNPKVLAELSQALHNAKFDDSRVVLLSGSGSIFCSGIDLNYLLSGDRRHSAQSMADAIRDFVNVVIAFPKPIVAAVNGPAIGFGAAILPLCDIIYASDKASFFCPYGRLGQTPEGCSSFTFPQVMGMAMANDMLLGGRKLTAIEAYQIGLVSQVFWPTSMMQEVIPRVQNIASQSIRSLEGSKLLIRSQQRGKMELTNETECRMLVDRWASAECQKAMRTYLDDELDYMM